MNGYGVLYVVFILMRKGKQVEFNEKLQELRKQRGMTQEELANALFVSRTAVSKWESGRGYPSIESLKQISKFFSVTVDELLSGEEVLDIAEKENREKETGFRDLVFGLLDISVAMFLFLPFFGYRTDGIVHTACLLSLVGIQSYLKIAYFVILAVIIFWGILILASQRSKKMFFNKYKYIISLVMYAVAALVFIISSQPYAAAFFFIFLLVKVMILTKKR